jgi:ABC-2 type transport system ATP-binding protein
MIEARGLTRRFGGTVAVESVSLNVPDGTILALLGPNGAGKTTTVRMLAGLIAPTAGEATVAGCDIRRAPSAVRARVGLVTDAPGLYEQMNVVAYLNFFGQIYGLPASTRTQRVGELLEFFELSDHRSERMAAFSKGMKQKVALARALLHEPAALFLDEPTSGLDPLAARAVRELVLTLKHSNRSIILCTHDLDEAERLVDQIVILRRGRMVACDTPTALRAQATSGTLVRVELARPHPSAREILGAIEGIHDIAAESAKSASETVFSYSTASPTTTNPQVIARLTAAGALIVSVTCETRTLEDVYAAAMGAESAEGAPASEAAIIAAALG